MNQKAFLSCVAAMACAATLLAAGEEFKLSSLVVTRHVSYSLKQIVLTRSIEETVAGRKTSSTTRHDTLGSESSKNTRTQAADATSGSKDTNAFSASGKLGGSVKFGIFSAISAEGGVDKQYGTSQTSENSSTSRSSMAFEREDKKATARNSSEEGSEAETYGEYRLVFSVALKNNDIDDPLQVDGKGASVRLEGLSLPVVVPYQERETFELGADEALCVFSYPVKDQVLLHELKQIDAQGAWSKITLTLVGSDFPIVSKKTKRNVLTEQSVAEQRSPTTEIEVDFGDLSRLSPWRVKQRYNRASGKRGQPVRLREALKAVNGIVAEDEEMPEDVFQFCQNGDLAVICGEPTRQSSAAGDLKMFGVRFTDASGNMTVRLPAGTALDAPLRDSTKITLFTFMLSEAAVQIHVNPERLAGFKADIESFLASGGDKAPVELWKKLLAEEECMSRVGSLKGYWVREGDSLDEIAASHGLATCVLKELNGLTNDHLRVGQLLVVASSRKGTVTNVFEIVECYRKGAKYGNAGAQYSLGVCYCMGAGVEEDFTEGVKWFRKAVGQGYGPAQNDLGYCYQNGKGVAKDPVEAVKWYRKAADQGLAAAQINLGLCYYEGEGVTKDVAEAVKWYRKAADQGLAVAQNLLGLCYDYDKGEGVEKDFVEAVKWYRKAADQGLAAAQFNLGLSYYEGEGVTKDVAEAVKWYRKAADQGFESARKKLRELGQ